MYYDNGSVIYDLEQWELDDLYQSDNDSNDEYFSFTTEQELD